MGKYWAIYRASLLSAITYRSAIGIWATNSIFSLLAITSIWLASQKPGLIATYTKDGLITYAIIALFLGWVLNWNSFQGAKAMIKTGTLSSKILLKPISFYWERLFNEFAWRSVFALVGITLSLGALLVFKNHLSLDIHPNWAVVIVFCICAALLQQSLCLILAQIAFWVTEVEALNSFRWLCLGLLGGSAIPISFVPQSAQLLVKLLPFRYMFSFPLELILGKISTNSEIFFGGTVAIFWLVILNFLVFFMWNKGLKKYTSVGN